MKYQVGQKFQKKGGDYSFEGIIVAVFKKLNGLERYVGENEDGLLFIFNEQSIELTDLADFDLPEVAGPKAKPRIHKGPGDSTCVSCEG